MRTLVLLAALSMLAAGCDQLTATVSAASVLTRTPDLANAENMQSSGLAPYLPLGALEVREGVGVLVAVGERETATSTAAPVPLSGATVQVGWDTDRITLCELTDVGAEGTYQATNVAGQECNRPLVYDIGSYYRTEIETGSALYTMSVEAPAPLEANLVEFTPQLSVASDYFGATLPRHAAGTPLTVDWSADTAVEDRHAFVTILRIRYVGGTGATDALDAASWQADPQPVWDNFPRAAGDMIDLVASEPDTYATVPQATFDQDGVYILVVTITEISSDVSTNLFLGSSALAGAGTAFVFWVD
jgi:hypothetical protein